MTALSAVASRRALPTATLIHSRSIASDYSSLVNIDCARVVKFKRVPTRRADNPMTKIQIELPDATATAAREAGLLTPQALERLLTDALRRRQAIDSLLSIADRVAEAGIAPMTEEQINAEVKAVRAERKMRARDS